MLMHVKEGYLMYALLHYIFLGMQQPLGGGPSSSMGMTGPPPTGMTGPPPTGMTGPPPTGMTGPPGYGHSGIHGALGGYGFPPTGGKYIFFTISITNYYSFHRTMYMTIIIMNIIQCGSSLAQ